ncbi:hypothetical protein JRO89_XS02G0080200 [Xanthoceras sorbifolium]|uniref:Uncharacterized protein n=1 Tax=Xanthoceras sorbifolium TaxID=99658 RepID=A0ABQ8IGG3_9ROSI|nr:hypothetical protein JRO89_XS02G0080200 [Xanthoceras sorbifolium]
MQIIIWTESLRVLVCLLSFTLVWRSSRQKMPLRKANPVSVRCEQSSQESTSLDVWLGRLAMVGFAAAISVEIATGKGLLEVCHTLCALTCELRKYFLMQNVRLRKAEAGLFPNEAGKLLAYVLFDCMLRWKSLDDIKIYLISSISIFVLQNFGLTSPLPTVALAVTGLVGVLTAVFIFQSASKN